MKTELRIFATLSTVVLTWTAAPQTWAGLIYQNVGNPPHLEVGTPFLVAAGPSYNASTVLPGQVGNQVIMNGWTPQNPDISLSEFRLDYWSTAPVTARVFFYKNDGPPYGSGGPLQPGSPLYASPSFVLPAATQGHGNIAAGVNELDWLAGSMIVPHEFTWAVEFTGLTGTDTAGLVLISPPTIGGNTYPYSYWQQAGSVWNTRTNLNPNVRMEFAAEFEGQVVPEPSPVLYGAVLCAGLGLWIVRRRARPELLRGKSVVTLRRPSVAPGGACSLFRAAGQARRHRSRNQPEPRR